MEEKYDIKETNEDTIKESNEEQKESYKSPILKFLPLLTSLLFAYSIYSTIINKSISNTVNNLSKKEVEVYPAHLREEVVRSKYGKNLQLIYSNTDLDKAYYINTRVQKDRIKKQKIKIKGFKKAEIVSVKEGYFLVKVSEPEKISSGLSGTAVTNIFGIKIGYVSQLDNNYLKCVNSN